MSMFCYQCEQTSHGSGCTNFGICGKDPDTAALQDLVVYVAKGISILANRARKLGVVDHEVDVITLEAMFATVTNVDFDPKRLESLLQQQYQILQKITRLYFHFYCCFVFDNRKKVQLNLNPITEISGFLKNIDTSHNS